MSTNTNTDANNTTTISSMQSLAAITAAADVRSSSSVSPGVDMAPLLNDMFEQLAKYANGEIEASSEEYELLEKLNLHAAKKYEHMADHAMRLVSAITTVQATHASLETFFAQIDQLEQNLTEIETVVTQLDLYSKRLHYTFQQVYK